MAVASLNTEVSIRFVSSILGVGNPEWAVPPSTTAREMCEMQDSAHDRYTVGAG
jgi:hypothetical protein